jgi:DNA-binding response OmpR family regulator
MRTLIAEDDATSRLMLSAILKKSGHEVLETTTGLEAWEVLQKPNAPLLAILDWMMPEMDGLDIIRRVRAVAPARSPYIIMLTAKTRKTDIAEALNAGADDYVTKPFDLEELRARVEVGCRMIKIQDELTTRAEELSQALDQIKTLSGILPVCANCNKIRDDGGIWQRMDVYLQLQSEVQLTHTICPDCAKKLYPDIDLRRLFKK